MEENRYNRFLKMSRFFFLNYQDQLLRMVAFIWVMATFTVAGCGRDSHVTTPSAIVAQDYVAQGWALYESGDYLQAREKFRTAINYAAFNRNYSDAGAHTGIGWCNLRLGTFRRNDPAGREAFSEMENHFARESNRYLEAAIGLAAAYLYRNGSADIMDAINLLELDSWSLTESAATGYVRNFPVGLDNLDAVAHSLLACLYCIRNSRGDEAKAREQLDFAKTLSPHTKEVKTIDDVFSILGI